MISNKRLRKLRKWLTIGIGTMLFSLWPLTISAEVQFATNSKDANGDLIWTQPAYYPVSVIGSGLTVTDKDNPKLQRLSPMTNPKDVFVDKNDHIFVVDTGNNRIVEFDPNGVWQRYLTVAENPLNKPEGIFVTEKGDIYIADTGNKRIVLLTPDGKFTKEYKRPESRYLPESYKYEPIKLVVDKRGFLYIAMLGGYEGLLQLDPEGQFQSFYGANNTELSALDKLKKSLYTKEMYANETRKLPGAISSVTVDKDGFIYTTTAGNVTKNQIKKLNIRGLNMLDKAYDKLTGKKESLVFGEVRPIEQKTLNGQPVKPQLVDLTVDINGNITAIDSSYKMFNQYDATGNLLFFWGGFVSSQTTQLGVIKSAVAIESNSKGELLVLDGQEGTIQVFRTSEFGTLVNKANTLTLQGKYEESELLWKEVLKYNTYFIPALIGLGKAAYKRGDYQLAQQYFYQGGNRTDYSNAFWQIRLSWFQQHFDTFATILVVSVIMFMALNRFTRQTNWRKALRNRKRSTIPLIVQLKYMFTIMRHPIDGFSALRYENKGSYGSALIILAMIFTSIVISQVYTGFTFNKVNPYQLNLLLLFGKCALLWIGWVVSNYMVSSIYHGEGRFRDVFIASSYALIPLIFVGIPLAAVSNIMTTSELTIYNFIWDALIIWTLAMFFWKIQSLQNYSVGETAINIVYSLFTFMMMIILIMIIFGLSTDLKTFIYEIFQEVKVR
ncbi:YIP1 family protein [Paenibacillus sp. 2RAB27]|uniref:YIP1 family protein n=1 Tax=Paenibacillus sp. 2RAB27 TaxID=3232991 RepID=UPI003F9E2121